MLILFVAGQTNMKLEEHNDQLLDQVMDVHLERSQTQSKLPQLTEEESSTS